MGGNNCSALKQSVWKLSYLHFHRGAGKSCTDGTNCKRKCVSAKVLFDESSSKRIASLHFMLGQEN